MKTETKHTPGPWHIKQNSTYFQLEDVERYPILRINGGMVPVKNNARLIAASPELFDALKNMIDCAKLIAERWESGDLADAIRSLQTDAKFAQKAIAKAEDIQ